MQEANAQVALQRSTIEASDSLNSVLQAARQEAVTAYRKLHARAAQEDERQTTRIQVGPSCLLLELAAVCTGLSRCYSSSSQ